MATQEIEKLIVSLEASTKKYEQALAKAQGTTVSRLRRMEKEAESFSTRFNQKLAGIGNGLKGIGAGFVAGLGVEVLAKAAASAIKSIADIGDAAKKLGLTNADFQTLKLGAQLAGVEVEALAGGMKKLGINSSDAVRGQGEFGAILKANNLSLTDANGKMRSQVEVLGIVADLVSNAANEQDALAIAQAALGKSGTELMGLLEQGAGGVQEAMRKAKEAGVQFTDEQIAKAQEFDDKINVLIEKISVGLKGAFIRAASGVEIFALEAIANLDSVGIKAGDVGQSILNALKINPIALSTTLAVGALGDAPARLKEERFAIQKEIAQINANLADADRALFANPEELKAANQQLKAILDDRYKRLSQIQSLLGSGPRAPATSDPNTYNTMGKSSTSPTVMPGGGSATADNKRAASSAAAERKRLAAATKAEATRNAREQEEELKRIRDEAERDRIEAADRIYAYEFDMAQKASEAFVERQNTMREGMMQLADMGVAALESVVNGSKKAKDAVKELALQFAEAALKAALLGQGPMGGAFGGGGGLFGKLLGSAVGAFAGGGVPVSLYHKGGIAGHSSGMSRNVSPAMFANAPRYHGGGIAGLKGGEVPAILQKGEVILPRGADGGQTVNVVVSLSDDLVGVVDQKVNAGMQRAVSVSVAQSAKHAKKNFDAMASEHNVRQQ